MTEWRMKSKRKPSGGLLTTKQRCTKKLAWKGRDFASTKIGTEEKGNTAIVRARGNNQKVKQRVVIQANISTGKGKTVKGKIINCLENPSNKHFVRRNVLTKGAIIEVEIAGKKSLARIANRPGQSGSINAVQLSETEAEKVRQSLIKPKKERKISSKKQQKPKTAPKTEPAETMKPETPETAQTGEKAPEAPKTGE